MVGGLKGVDFLKEVIENGYCIIAEIYRLLDLVPADFADPSGSKFKQLLIDFSYFDNLSVIDNFIDSNEQGQQLEEDFFFTFDRILKQFGLLFDSTAQFFSDIVEISENSFSGDTSSLVRLSTLTLQRFQLQAEVLYVTGIVLLSLVNKFSSGERQRLFVAHYRNNPTSSDRFDLLVDVLKTDANNIEQLFSKLPIKKESIDNIIAVLRSNTLFSDEGEYFSNTDMFGNRATPMQRAVITVALFFAPHILHSNSLAMRQIIDVFFVEDWVVPLHLGIIINLVHVWENFKAANVALQQTITVQMAKSFADSYLSKLKKIIYPQAAKLSVNDFTDSATAIVASNRYLRWIILHSYKCKVSKRASQYTDAVCSLLSNFDLYQHVIDLCSFEYEFKEAYRKALINKLAAVENVKKDISQHLCQMAELFANDAPLQKTKKNLKLQDWLLLMEKKISELEMSDSGSGSPYFFEHVKERIEQVSELHDLTGNVTVGQYLENIRSLLTDLSHLSALSENFLSNIESICDFSYAWDIVEQWSSQMEKMVRSDPLSIRSLFVKLASSIALALKSVETPARVNAISLCYSHQLETRLRKALQAIPRSLFVLLDQIANLLDEPLSSTLNKSKVRQFADPDRRLKLAESTHSVSTYALGITTMQLTWLGSVKVDPSTLLIDGIRRELVNQTVSSLCSLLTSSQDLPVVLANLDQHFSRLHRAFIYICEHMALNGFLLWHYEIARLMGYMLEKECNIFFRHTIADVNSAFQSKSAPLPIKIDVAGSASPLGRICFLIMNTCDLKMTYYVNSASIWCDFKTKKTVFSGNSFFALQKTLSPLVLWSLDRIFCFNLVKELNVLCSLVSKVNVDHHLADYTSEFSNLKAASLHAKPKIFENAMGKFSAYVSLFVSHINSIGRLQLLRSQLIEATETSVQQRAPHIYDAVLNLNNSLLSSLQEKNRFLCKDLLIELATLLERCGIVNPYQKVFIRRECPHLLVETLFITLVSVLPKFNATKRSEWVDISVFCAGISCLLTQFKLFGPFLSLCIIYINFFLTNSKLTTKSPPNMSHCLHLISHFSCISPEELNKVVPVWMLS